MIFLIMFFDDVVILELLDEELFNVEEFWWGLFLLFFEWELGDLKYEGFRDWSILFIVLEFWLINMVVVWVVLVVVFVVCVVFFIVFFKLFLCNFFFLLVFWLVVFWMFLLLCDNVFLVLLFCFGLDFWFFKIWIYDKD